MPANLTTLRPGLLVSLSTTIRGNVKYRTVDLEADHLTDEGARRARWETERTIEDPAEHEAAIKVRSKCRSLIVACCSGSAFGLLCPESSKPKLDAAIEEARALAAQFNATAQRSAVGVYVIAGRIAADDAEAVRAIRSEVGELLREMEEGANALDAKRIREAAGKAKELSAMLSDDAAARVNMAIEEARAFARKAVRAASDAGERAALEADRATLARLASARASFLDLDAPAPADPLPVPAAALDLAPVEEAPPAPAPSIPVPAFEV